MNVIQGVVKNGQIAPDVPADWPEGTRVAVAPVEATSAPNGASEDDWDPSPAGIARRLALMDQMEPLLLTPEERAEWEAARRAQQEFEKASFDQRAERVRRMWE